MEIKAEEDLQLLDLFEEAKSALHNDHRPEAEWLLDRLERLTRDRLLEYVGQTHAVADANARAVEIIDRQIAMNQELQRQNAELVQQKDLIDAMRRELEEQGQAIALANVDAVLKLDEAEDKIRRLNTVRQELDRKNLELSGIMENVRSEAIALASANVEAVLLLDSKECLIEQLRKKSSELVAMKQELEKRNVELEKLNDLKNQLLGMAAHDLRTPLGAIFTYSEFLIDEASRVLTQEQMEFLATIKSTSELLLKMVNELLDISTIEAGKLELDLKPTDLVALIDHNVSLHRPLAENKRIRLEFQCDRTFSEMMLDQSKAGQVLDNLISNAIKFSHPGSAIAIGASEIASHVVVSVSDQGPGIPQAELERLFNPFEKTSVKSTAGEKSTGLGLAIVRKMVEGHHGSVWVESEVGKGSIFYFSLPIAAPIARTTMRPTPLHAPVIKDEETLSESLRAAPAASGPSFKILLAEDTLVNQQLIVRILEKGGHQVKVVDNGGDAIAAFDRESFDLILMDVHMPEVDGFAATAAIREKEKITARHVPIVALTALAMSGDRQRCLDAGMPTLPNPSSGKSYWNLSSAWWFVRQRTTIRSQSTLARIKAATTSASTMR
jgi:signal transduction histidine kinase